MKRPTALIATAIALALTPAAVADEVSPPADREEFSFSFEYNPATINTTEGAEEAYDKLYRRVKRECMPDRGSRALRVVTPEVQTCIDETMSTAVQTFDMESITLQHELATER